MTENFAVEVEQRHAHIARRAEGSNVRIIAVNIEQIVRNMDQAAAVDHSFARRSVHHHLPAVDPLITHPEGKRLEAARLREIFRYPSAAGIQRGSKIFYQGFVKLFAGLGGGAFENRPKGRIDINILQGSDR